jgi:hypothetical protein
MYNKNNNIHKTNDNIFNIYTINFNKNNNIYNTNNIIFNINTFNYNKNNNIYNTKNTIFKINTFNYNKHNNIDNINNYKPKTQEYWVLKQDASQLDPDPGPKRLGSIHRTLAKYVLMHDPKALGPNTRPKAN